MDSGKLETRTESPAERGRRFAAEGLKAGAVIKGITGDVWVSVHVPVGSIDEGREILKALRAACNSGGGKGAD